MYKYDLYDIFGVTVIDDEGKCVVYDMNTIELRRDILHGNPKKRPIHLA